MQAFLPSYLELSLASFTQQQEKMRSQFGNLGLAGAAYNAGPRRVQEWLAGSGPMPQETRNYVPCILSIIIISKNQKRYGFSVKADPPLNYDMVELPAQTDLKVVADLMGVPYETVQDLNAELRRGTSPASQRYAIKIPKGMKKQFEVAYAALPEEQRVRKITVPAEEVAERYRSSYRVQVASYQVRRGDTLASVARRSGVSVKELARMNRMSARGELRRRCEVPGTGAARRAELCRRNPRESPGPPPTARSSFAG